MLAATDLADLMVDLADSVCACLASTPSGSPSTCSIYWSDPPDDLDCDCSSAGAVLVWLDDLFVSESFPAPLTAAVRSRSATAVARIAVRVIRPCWPIVGSSTGPNHIPTRDETFEPSRNLTVDAATVLCCLLSEAKSGAGVFSPCSRVMLGTVTPDRNRGGCAGFTVRLTVDLGACCDPIAGS